MAWEYEGEYVSTRLVLSPLTNQPKIYIHGSLHCDGEMFLINLMGGTFFQAKETMNWQNTLSRAKICPALFGERIIIDFDNKEYERICRHNKFVGFGGFRCPPENGFLLLSYFFNNSYIIENDPRLKFFRIYNIPVEIEDYQTDLTR